MASKPKTLLMSEKMPRDFWNYDVNPITGYKTNRELNFSEKDERDGKKYEMRIQNLGIIKVIVRMSFMTLRMLKCSYRFRLVITLIFTPVKIMQQMLEACSETRKMPCFQIGFIYRLVIMDEPPQLLSQELKSEDLWGKPCVRVAHRQPSVLANYWILKLKWLLLQQMPTN